MTTFIDIKDIPNTDTKKLSKRIKRICTVTSKANVYSPEQSVYKCYLINSKNSNKFLVPIGVPHILREKYDYKFPQNSPVTHDEILTELNTQPLTKSTDPKGYRDQDVVITQALKILKKYNSVFLALATGFGKTFIGVYLSMILGLKTLVICQLARLNSQEWPSEYKRFSNAKVQIIKSSKANLDPNADVYIVGIEKMSRMDRNKFSTIGTVIYDEAHLGTKKACTTSLMYIQPRYLIGLSATPIRADGLHNLLVPYFREPERYISRFEVKKFTVVKYCTKYVPEVEYITVFGKLTLKWSTVINSLAKNVERNNEIIDILLQHPDRNIMVLCDRVEQCKSIASLAESANIKVDTLYGSKSSHDPTCQVLVAGIKKAGVGFNDPTRNMLVIVCDVKELQLRQYEGRIRCADNIIYHLVDKFSTLEKHWKGCEGWYRKRGAVIQVRSYKDKKLVKSAIDDDESTPKKVGRTRMLPSNK